MALSAAQRIQEWKLETEFLSPGERRHAVPRSGTFLGWLRKTTVTWRHVKHLGHGGYGEVWKEECISGPLKRSVRAVKQIRKTDSRAPQRELEALTMFSDPDVTEVSSDIHPIVTATDDVQYRNYLVRCSGWFDDISNIYIVMEYMQNGDLQNYIKSKGQLSESETAVITIQVIEALQHMHRHKFVHRDLKPGVGDVKLSSFGYF